MNFNNTHFQVQIGEHKISCSKVSNLVFNIEYTTTRTGTDKDLTIKHHMGNKVFTPITIERPIERSNNTLFDFWQQGNPLKDDGMREIGTATIQLLDKKSNVVVQWTLINPQFPQLSYSDLDAKGNEIAMERLEIIHEGIQIDIH